MDKIAATIRAQYDSLIEAYNQRLQAISGAALSNQTGDELVSTLFRHLVDALETGGETEFVQNWVANGLAWGITPETLQVNLTAFEQTLIPLATTLESATTLWQIFSQIRAAIVAQTTERLNGSVQKQTEQQLRKNEARLAEATAIAKLYYWELDVATQTFTFTPEFYKSLNIPITDKTDFKMSAEEYAQKYVHPEEVMVIGQQVETALTSSEAEYSNELEARSVTTDGQIIPVLVRFRLVRDEAGNPIKLVGANQDITEQKSAEEALRRSEAQLSQALKIAKLAYWEYDVENDLFIFNDQFYALFHTTAEEHGGYQLSSAYYAQHFVHPDDLPVVGSEIERALNSPDRYYNRLLDHRILYADGGVGYISASINIERDEQGNILRYYGANQDVTERKTVEAELRKRASELAAVAEISTQVEQISDPMEMLQTVVDLTKERFGLYHAHVYLLDEAGEMLKLAAGAGEAGRTMVAQGWSIPFAHGSSLVALTARKQVGTIVNDVQANPDFLPNPLLPETRSEMAVPLLVGDRLIGVLDVQGDEVDRFTEQDIQIETTLASQVAIALQNAQQYQQTQETLEKLRRSEEVLRKNEARLEEAVAAAKLYHWEFDFATQIFTFSPEYYRLLNIPITDETDFRMSAEEFAQKHVENPELVGKEVEKALALGEIGYSGKFEDHNVTTDGRLIPMMVRIKVIRDENGNPIRSIGANQDITEQKRAEQQLRENEARLAEATAIAKLYYWEFDFATQIFTFSPEYYKALNIPITDETDFTMSAEKFTQEYLPPESAEITYREIEKAVASTESDYSREFERFNLTADGRLIPMMVRLRLIKDEAGNPLKAVGAYQDITEQKRIQEILAKQAGDLQKVAEISTRIATTHNEAQLLQEVVDLTKDRFGLYHAHLYLLDERGETLILTAGAGEVGQAMVAEGRTIPFNHLRSIVALTARTSEGTIVNNVRENPDFLPHPLLPETRSEMAVAMIVGDQLLGVFDVQADVVDRFTEDDRQILTTLAAQVAVALENARLLAQVERALADVKIVQQQYIQQAWGQVGQTQKRTYRYERSGFTPLAEEIRQKAKDLAHQKEEPELVTLDSDMEGVGQKSVVAPVRLSGAIIGSLQLHLTEGQNEGQVLDEDDLALLEVILKQVAQSAENFRLFEETRRRADYERLVGEITQKIRQAPSLEMLAQTAAEALSEVLDVPTGLVSLNVTSPQGTEKVGTNGQTKKR